MRRHSILIHGPKSMSKLIMKRTWKIENPPVKFLPSFPPSRWWTGVLAILPGEEGSIGALGCIRSELAGTVNIVLDHGSASRASPACQIWPVNLSLMSCQPGRSTDNHHLRQWPLSVPTTQACREPRPGLTREHDAISKAMKQSTLLALPWAT